MMIGAFLGIADQSLEFLQLVRADLAILHQLRNQGHDAAARKLCDQLVQMTCLSLFSLDRRGILGGPARFGCQTFVHQAV